MKLIFLIIVIGGVYIINLDLYYVFHVTAIEKNFSKAAGKLFITQPSVSHSIRQLENQMGVVLFQRTSKGVILSKEGEVLFKHTKKIFELVNNAEQIIHSMKNLKSGTLSIGGSDSTFKHYLMPYIQSFQTLYPDVHIKIRHGSTPDIIENLFNHSIDIGFVHLPVPKDELQIHSFLDIESTFVVGKKYKYLSNQVLNLEEIQSYPIISFSERSSARRFLDQLFKKAYLEIQPDIEVGSVELLIEAAKMNMGISFITKELVQDALDAGELFEVNVNVPIEKRKIGIALNKNNPMSIVMEQFLKHINTD